MRQPVDTNVLAELEEIEIEFWMYKYKRYDRTAKSWNMSNPTLPHVFADLHVIRQMQPW